MNEYSHEERKGLTQQFVDKPWATVETQRVDFETYLDRMWRCKFVLCPRGNAIDCHRNWETIYMRRVPVMKRTPFLEELYKDYQVLFVDDYSEVTEQLLLDNNQMFLDAQTQDLSKLDLNNFFEKWKNLMPYSPFSSTEVTFFNKIKSEIDVMFDIGSRDDIDYLANSMDKSRSFHMFEPDPNFVSECFRQLETLDAPDGIDNEVYINNFGIGAQEGELEYFLTLNHLFFAQFILVL